MLSSTFNRLIAATVGGAMALSLAAPAFAAPMFGAANVQVLANSGQQLTDVGYRGRRNGAAIGGAVALGILGLGIAAIAANQQNQNDGYYDPEVDAPVYQPRYAPVYQQRYVPVYQKRYVPVYQPRYAPVYQQHYAPVYQPRYAPVYQGYQHHDDNNED